MEGEEEYEETPVQNEPFNQNSKTCGKILRKPDNKSNMNALKMELILIIKIN